MLQWGLLLLFLNGLFRWLLAGLLETDHILLELSDFLLQLLDYATGSLLISCLLFVDEVRQVTLGDIGREWNAQFDCPALLAWGCWTVPPGRRGFL